MEGSGIGPELYKSLDDAVRPEGLHVVHLDTAGGAIDEELGVAEAQLADGVTV